MDKDAPRPLARDEAPPSLPPKREPRFTFDGFVVDRGNRFAHAAAQLAIDAPGTTANPLFLYGAARSGKTHLLSAIGHEMQRRHRDWRVVMTTAERFSSDLVASWGAATAGARASALAEFHARHRDGADVLLVDDVQHLAHRDAAQEEFCRAFDAAHAAGRQIVVTCDRLPSELDDVEERLRERFTWGLIAELARPPQLDVSAARVVSIEEIQRHVAESFGVRLNDLRGPKRHRAIAHPRMVAMYLARRLTAASYPEIGARFGGKDHSTVISAVRKIERTVTDDPSLAALVARIEAQLRDD